MAHTDNMARSRIGLLALLLMLAPPARSFGLGPNEVVVLVNKDSQRSLEVANHFVQLRNVPPINVIYLTLPESVLYTAAEMSPEDFAAYISGPVMKTIRDRRIEDHILAWIYSVDFPVRITTDPPMSLQGMTFVRNNIPGHEAIHLGKFASPLFAGPDLPGGPSGPSLSLEQFTSQLRQHMPIPSMMLGYTGARGMSVDQVVRNLKYGVISDGSLPQARVAFVLRDDPRSHCRSWQFDGAQQELKQLGIMATISSNMPDRQTELIGLQIGAMRVSPSTAGSFVPGAMAEHLTSFAAFFHDHGQTVLTEWLRAGVTASAGTVAEPMSIWTKFPHARFFAHYAQGCTMLESFFLSIRCPLQILIVGEPLAKPYARQPAITLVNLDDDTKPLKNEAEFMATAWPGVMEEAPEFLYLLDGRSLNHPPGQPVLKINTSLLNDGAHELRAIAYAKGAVRHQAFASKWITTRNRDKSVVIESPKDREHIDLHHPMQVHVSAEGTPTEMALVCNERILLRTAYEPGRPLILDPLLLGAGPVAVQAIALYGDREAVRSLPVSLIIEPLNQAPSITSIDVGAKNEKITLLTPTGADPEGDSIQWRWFQPLAMTDAPSSHHGSFTADNGQLAFNETACTLRATTNTTAATWSLENNGVAKEISVSASVPHMWPGISKQVAGLVFDYANEKNFSYFGLFGDISSWVIGQCVEGTLRHVTTRGAYLEPDKWYLLSLRANAEGGIDAYVNNERLFTWKDKSLGAGRLGILAGIESARFRDYAVSPPLAPKDTFMLDGAALAILNAELVAGMPLLVRAHDHQKFSERAFVIPARPTPAESQ